MRALTLIRPWCWAIAHGGKDVENRTWQPPESIFGQRIAIHSGLKWDDEAAVSLIYAHRSGPRLPSPEKWPGGRIVATAVVDGTIAVEHGTPLAGLSLSRWFVGPVGWLLRDVIALREPVPCRGAQGLWTLPVDIEERVRAQEAA